MVSLKIIFLNVRKIVMKSKISAKILKQSCTEESTDMRSFVKPLV